MNPDRDTVYFISDAHFGIHMPGYENRELLFRSLVDRMLSNATDLFIVGDLFDFWIEYRFAIRPDYFPVLYDLARLVQAGVRVHYLAGNHDFALGSFLEKRVGVTVHCDEVNLQIQGKSVHLFHGDGILKKDVGYRILKKLLRNRTCQKLYKIIHPNQGIAFGIFCSGSSRKYTSRRLRPSMVEEYRMAARHVLETQGNDLVVYGHTHHGELINFGEKAYLNTGAWLVHQNYATLFKGKVSLWKFVQDSEPEPVAPIDWKRG
ncbi:MAG: UDP-2,3-diacylglucosamine diphosphatase [Chitinispirillaceae bacterium]